MILFNTDNLSYRYSPWDEVQLFSTKPNGYTSSKGNRPVSESFPQISSSFWWIVRSFGPIMRMPSNKIRTWHHAHCTSKTTPERFLFDIQEGLANALVLSSVNINKIEPNIYLRHNVSFSYSLFIQDVIMLIFFWVTLLLDWRSKSSSYTKLVSINQVFNKKNLL
mgnify:CR=1 FL=1